MDYTATKFSTVADKQRFEKQFKQFVSGGFQEKHFPKTFYRQLSNCFGFIAHYDRNGFYATYFTNPDSKAIFLRCVLENPCYGDPAFTYSDVERELQSWVFVSGLLEKVEAEAHQVLESQERQELARLQAKYQDAP